MYEVTVEDSFAAGHYLRNYRGKCENPHGHNYKVRITLQGPELDQAGLLLDFKELKLVMKPVIERLDHRMINDVVPFTTLNPSAENLAKFFFDETNVNLKSSTSGRVSGARSGRPSGPSSPGAARPGPPRRWPPGGGGHRRGAAPVRAASSPGRSGLGRRGRVRTRSRRGTRPSGLRSAAGPRGTPRFFALGPCITALRPRGSDLSAKRDRWSCPGR